MSQNSEPVDQKIQAMLEAMWKKSQPIIAERLATLRQAQQQIKAGNLGSHQRKEAESAAHKLTGILGTFGLPACSILTSKIERILAQPGEIGEDQQHELGEWLDQLESGIAAKDS